MIVSLIFKAGRGGGGLFERRLEHTAHCIFAGKGIGHTCQSNHREPTKTFYLQITLIYAHVIISEYSLEHRYIDMFMTSSIDWIKNTQDLHSAGFFHCDTIFDRGPRSSPSILALMQISDERVR